MNENIMRAMGFGKAVDNVRVNKCGMCGNDVVAGSFRDELSVREYGISGMCQECQDKFWRCDKNGY